MREAKYRCWSRKFQEMTYNVDVYADGDVFHNNCQILKPIKMQYTGLKDKNGKEIYEGDIVNVSFCSCQKVEWDNKKEHPCFINGSCLDDGKESEVFEVMFDKVFANFNFKHEVEGHYNDKGFCEGYAKTDFEVIGNIYENPELINKQ